MDDFHDPCVLSFLTFRVYTYGMRFSHFLSVMYVTVKMHFFNFLAHTRLAPMCSILHPPPNWDQWRYVLSYCVTVTVDGFLLLYT